MKNLTRTAGFGNGGMQGAASIAVHEPSVHWSGTKALFSMVVGAPSQQYVWESYDWQIYEVTKDPLLSKQPLAPIAKSGGLRFHARPQAERSVMHESN